MGDGVATQAITGLGFTPEYVMTMADGSHWAYNRTNQGTVESRRLRNGGTPNNGIPSLDINGFTVGNAGSSSEFQNETGVTYHYIALNDVPGKIKVGGYAGTRVLAKHHWNRFSTRVRDDAGLDRLQSGDLQDGQNAGQRVDGLCFGRVHKSHHGYSR